MKRGRNICHQLKALRRQIADENGIELQQPECTYEGECKGTCPRCEYELHYLENELTHRQALGKAVTVAGISLTLASCGGETASSSKMLSRADDTYEVIQTGGIEEEDDDLDVLNTTEPDTLELEGIAILNPIDHFDTSEPAYSFKIKDGSPNESNEASGSLVAEPEDEEFVEEEEMLLGMINEKFAEFPGGEDSLYAFLNKNIKYPSELDTVGRVVVKFTIEKDGSITNPSILRDIGGGAGEEVLRVVRLMPKWKPGSYLGKPVRQEFSLPVDFSNK